MISCYGAGRDGWWSFLNDKEIKLRYNYKQYGENYATGLYVDVTTGLFSFDDMEKLKAFVREDGTYGTGVCKDYNGNWMLRRTLWTDADGTEHVGEGTVTSDGRILDPITIREYKYKPNTLYPLTGSWRDLWFHIYVDENGERRGEDCELEYNFVVPLSFFEYLQHHYQMYAFGELSSRTFLTKVSPTDDGSLWLNSVLEYCWVYDDFPYDIEERPMYMSALVSMDGEVIEPLHIDILDSTRQCYIDAYKNYLEKIADMPKPWFGDECTDE